MGINNALWTPERSRIAEETGKQANLAQALNMAKAVPATFLGLPGDLTDLATSIINSRAGYDAFSPEPSKYSTEGIGKMLGADTDSGGFMLGSIGFPDLTDAIRMAPLFALKATRKAKKAKNVFGGKSKAEYDLEDKRIRERLDEQEDLGKNVTAFPKQQERLKPYEPSPIGDIDYEKFIRDNDISVRSQGSTKTKGGKIVPDFVEVELDGLTVGGDTVESAIENLIEKVRVGGGDLELPYKQIKAKTRKEIVDAAKEMGIRATGKTEDIERKVNILTSDPKTWTREDFDMVKHDLSIHQDMSGKDNVQSIMDRGLDSGMFDSVSNIDEGWWSWSGGLTGNDAYLMRPRDMKLWKDTPYLEAGSKPFYHFKPEQGQNIYEAITGNKSIKAAEKAADSLEKGSDFSRIMRDRKALDDYENDIDFVQADTIDYSIDDRLGKRMKGGKYRGSPAGIDAPHKLKPMRKRLAGYLEAGAPGRLWYDESTKATGELTGNRRNFKHLKAGSDAITSRGAAVQGNQLFGTKGYNQAITGNPAHTGRFPNVQGDAIDQLASGKTYYGGPKETPFYEGLTIDERAQGVRPTNDLWMARAFGYKRKNPKTGQMEEWSEGLGPAQHRFMDNEINALVDVANKSKIGGVDDWTPERVQAAIWVAVKAEKEGTTVEKAAKNFAHGLDDLTATVRWEAKPSTSLDHLGGFSDTEEYTNLHRAATQTDDGRDRLAMAMGGLTRPSEPGYGQYGDVISPSTGMRVMAAPATGSAAIDPASEGLINALASVRGLNEGQDTVGTTFLRAPKKGEPANAARIEMGQTPSQQVLDNLNQELQQAFGTSDVFAVHTGSGVEILNQAGIDPAVFNRGVRNITQSLPMDPAHNSGKLIGNAGFDEPGFEPGYKPSKWMEQIDRSGLGENAMKRLESGAMDEASILAKLDALIQRIIPGAGKVDPILTRAREILSTAGFDGIREAVKQGILPVAILGLLGLGAVDGMQQPEPEQSF